MQKTLRNSGDKAHAKSFSSVAGQSRAPKKVVEPLTRSFFGQLIKLETDFYNKQYTAETLDELTQLYAKAVEYYDTIKDEIASYFIYKIQDALASKKSLKILLDQNAKVALRKSSLISSSEPILESSNVALSPKGEEIELKHEVIEEDAEEHSEDEDDVNVEEFKKKRKAYYEKRNRTQRVSFSTMKNQKQKFVHFFHKMETQKAQQKQNMNTLIDDYSKSAIGNDETVKDDLSSQKERFKAKLEQRKQKSMMTHTLNSSTQFMALRTSLQNIGGSVMRKDPYDNRLEDVLKGLDEDDAQFEAAGLAQPDQGEDGGARSNEASEKAPSTGTNGVTEKHGIFKSEQIEFLLPMKINNFEDGSNPDSLAFISPRDNAGTEQKLSKVLSEDSSRAVDTVSGGENVQSKAAEPENISS